MLNYEDQVLAPVVLGEEADDGVKPLRMRVALPKACIGPCEITARYALPPLADAGQRDRPRAVGHALDAELAGQQRLGHPGRRAAGRSRSRRLDGGRGRTGPGSFATDAGVRRHATHRGNRAQAARRKRRCGRRGRSGVDPDLRDQVGDRGTPRPRRAATHHAAPRTGDHLARRRRPRSDLGAVERRSRQSPHAGRARADRPLVRRRRAAALPRSACNIIFPARGWGSRSPGTRLRVEGQ